MVVRMTREEIAQERLRMDTRAKANEQNKRIEKLKERLTDTRAIAQLNEYRDGVLRERIRVLECTLADARRDHAVLVRLVERMGRAIMGGTRLDFTVIGQRQRDAELHEAEGSPPTRESEGAWGHE